QRKARSSFVSVREIVDHILSVFTFLRVLWCSLSLPFFIGDGKQTTPGGGPGAANPGVAGVKGEEGVGEDGRRAGARPRPTERPRAASPRAGRVAAVMRAGRDVAWDVRASR